MVQPSQEGTRGRISVAGSGAERISCSLVSGNTAAYTASGGWPFWPAWGGGCRPRPALWPSLAYGSRGRQAYRALPCGARKWGCQVSQFATETNCCGTILHFAGRLAPELRSSCSLSTSTRGPSGTFFTRRRSAAIFDRLVQTLRVEYWRNWRRAVQTLQVSSLAGSSMLVSIQCHSFVSDAVHADRVIPLSALLVQTETYGPTKMAKSKKVQGKKARKDAARNEKRRMERQQAKERLAASQNQAQQGTSACRHSASGVAHSRAAIDAQNDGTNSASSAAAPSPSPAAASRATPRNL